MTLLLWCSQEYLSRSVYRWLISLRMLMILSCIHYETLLHFNEDFVQTDDFLDDFYAENHRGLTSEEHPRFLGRVNAVRDQRNKPLIDLVTLRDALSIWTPCNTDHQPIHLFIPSDLIVARALPRSQGARFTLYNATSASITAASTSLSTSVHSFIANNAPACAT